jgi:hypothetical protein
MTSAPRGTLADRLITPQNAAFLLIDYQPAAVRSMDHLTASAVADHVCLAG